MADSSAPPSGTLTFLFSDVEGSTQLWEDHRTAMERALERHDQILSSAIEGHGGYVFSTGGDSFCAAFPRSVGAVQAAVAVQRQLGATDWEPEVELRVRIGIHSGEAVERGGDYFGPEVNRAARLMGTAHGGQIVVSGATASLLELEPIMLRELGRHRLKDLRSPMAVWQVVDRSLESEFPPLRSLNSFQHNLPVGTDELVGRHQEVDDVTALVTNQRLVTVVGPGGMGKTRVALQVGAELVDSYPDGAFFVDLTGATTDLESVASAIGRALRMDARSGETWVETVVSALSVYDLLLILDNCEHVLDAIVPLIRRLLDETAGVSVLATSRERLGVAIEHSYSLESLTAGSELFNLRAQGVDPSFDSDRAAAAVSVLCERLDGLPLAIELAAGRVRTLQPEEMITRLDQRFRLLRNKDRSTQNRHRTLLATVEWSYDQLSIEAKRFFCDLGVFTGWFDLDAAVGLAADEMDDLDVADLLEDLEAKSLISAGRDYGFTQYRLLETMAAFALQRLAEDGRTAEVRQRHAQMRANVTAEKSLGLYDEEIDPAAAFALLRSDLDDIESAFVWACTFDPPLAERILEASQFLWGGCDGGSRPHRMGQLMLQLYDSGDCSQLNAARSVAAAAMVGQFDFAYEFITNLLKGDPDPEAEALAVTIFAWLTVVMKNDPEEGAVLTERAIELIPNLSDRFTQGYAYWIAVPQFAHTGNFERGAEVLQSEGLAAALPDFGFLLESRAFLEGHTLRGTDPAASTERFEQGLKMAQQIDDTHGAAWLGYHLAINRLIERDYERAAQELAAVLPGLLARGDHHAVAFAFGDYGDALGRLGQTAQATMAFAIADAQFSRLHMTTYDAYLRRRDRLLDRYEETLGQDRFVAAKQAGQDMTIDEAVSNAPAMLQDSPISKMTDGALAPDTTIENGQTSIR